MNTDVKLLNRGRGYYPADNADMLVVLLHAFRSQPSNMQRLAEVAREEYPHADLFVPRLPFFAQSLHDPQKVAETVIGEISKLPTAGYGKIILVGHSMGAVLARKIWALANGALPDGTISKEHVAWGPKISRIVQLAAFNRGWTLSSPLDFGTRIVWTAGVAAGNLVRYVLRRDPIIFAFRRGATFLTLMRLQCLALDRQMGPSGPETIQLLGTSDDFVAPTDNVDLATGYARETDGKKDPPRFHYIEAENATHKGIRTLDGNGSGNDALDAFRIAIAADAVELAKRETPFDEIFDLNEGAVDDLDASRPPMIDTSVQHVVFIMHGIRDRGFWTRRLARAIKRHAKESGVECRTVTSTYGYFAMGPFLLPWVRRHKVEWFLDQYVTAKALYPADDVKFSYIGHSNGTYILAKALDLCKAVVMQNVVFAGSVVRTHYPWDRLIESAAGSASAADEADILRTGQVKGAVATYTPSSGAGRSSPNPLGQVKGKVANYVATKDWVVAGFTNGLELLHLQDLGGAGHRGFTTIPRKNNLEYVVGDHGAALNPMHWDEMAKFVVDDTFPTIRTASDESVRQRWWVVALGYLSPLIWIGLTVLILGLAFWILEAAAITNLVWLAVFFLYLWLIYLLLAKV